MPGPQKSETLQKPIATVNPEATIKKLAKSAIREGADPVTALIVAAEAAAHQPGGNLHNQAED